ncbi:extensin-like [Phyllostomus hastatus]|uniref:extensin-like n=1 Tax=Phyllostomus hastatus TaxID=9423 RepID=UPI001E67E844|nr:extensin-like [Phyllostomus hastatus]
MGVCTPAPCTPSMSIQGPTVPGDGPDTSLQAAVKVPPASVHTLKQHSLQNDAILDDGQAPASEPVPSRTPKDSPATPRPAQPDPRLHLELPRIQNTVHWTTPLQHDPPGVLEEEEPGCQGGPGGRRETTRSPRPASREPALSLFPLALRASASQPTPSQAAPGRCGKLRPPPLPAAPQWSEPVSYIPLYQPNSQPRRG